MTHNKRNFARRVTAADWRPVGKLVVVKAVYGDLPSGASTDVTQKVAAKLRWWRGQRGGLIGAGLRGRV
jgi:hypothetical protein